MAKETLTAKGQMVINEHDERATWLRHATDKLRPDFEKSGLPLPDKIRFGFSTKGKGTKKTGECWHSPASADSSYEIFIRADRGDPYEILGILVRELVHAALPVEDSHGKKFKTAATKIGLVGKMREAVPGHLLEPRLRFLLDDLGPLPHAPLDITWSAFDKPKRQIARMLKATCTAQTGDNELAECGYTIRLAAKWAKLGARCPVHGDMKIEIPEDEQEQSSENEAEAVSYETLSPSDNHSDHSEHSNHHHEDHHEPVN